MLSAAAMVTGTPALAQAAPTIQLSIGTDPAESITTQLAAQGAAPGNYRVTATVKAAGGQSCGANPDADNGTEVIFVYEATPTFAETTNYTFNTAGSYLLCGWVTSDNDVTQVLAQASLPITVRPPHLSLAINAPPTVQPNQTFQITTTAQAETSRTADEVILPDTGSGCPANADAASSASGSTTLIYLWDVVGGPLTQTTNEMLSNPGGYLLCAYFEYPNTSSTPEATASAKITVMAPPPPPPTCVVPQVGARLSLAMMQQSLQAAHCTGGQLRYAASRTVPQGDVVGLSPAPGTQLASGASIDVVLSTGAPCIVPSFRPGATRASVQHALGAAHCSVGRTSSGHSSRVRKGRVLALFPSPGTQLGSGASVGIRVSSGPRRH